MVRRGFFEDIKSDYGIAKEEQEVFLDREMSRSLSDPQGNVDDNTDTKGPVHGCKILGMH
jgi:hypothetical protein